MNEGNDVPGFGAISGAGALSGVLGVLGGIPAPDPGLVPRKPGRSKARAKISKAERKRRAAMSRKARR